ncbi:DNA polymerase III subunit alpha [Leeia sp. TBRC 13508]|uniref:DNA polymerase III subunit alpha n=1 Tax=Leeia speluncae TaxID=2884804 RepID=A0ABS8D997_9NEIS|nr:DNA polymerase III subunit alpha [Leeia speluncae]MCB6184511.1 DNA polymerase III subunit alpha [Leeia speluncae]
MNTPRFVHLRLHSEYSVVDGIVRVDDAVKAALKDQMPAMALTDLANVFGMVKFYKAARGKGLKAIIGCDIWVSNHADRDKPHRLLILVKNRQGYGRLCDLLTMAFRKNQYRGRGEVMPEWLIHQAGAESTEHGGDNSGLLALSATNWGEVGINLANGNHAAAVAAAKHWEQCFPNNFFLEIQRTGDSAVDGLVAPMAQLAVELGLPLVATHPVQFMTEDDFKAHEARVCISEGFTLSDKRRPKHFTPQQYFKTQDQMCDLFADYPEALANTLQIAKLCNLTVTLGKNYLPLFPTPDGMTLDDFLVYSAKEGLEKRLIELYPDEAKRDEERPRYLDRLKFETDTILQMGFPGYFLIVADFINWAKNNGCPVGPGRGSGAGSLVAYSLGITDLDPTAYALLFERFLNPERVSMPDFDIDFCQDNRWRVIEYVRHKYGVDAVSQIATFGTMAAKAVVRDVGRVLDLPYNFCDGISKLIPAAPGKQYSLSDAVEMEPILRDRLENEEELKELWDLATRLEGMTRNIGMHAGGVLIAPGKITDFCPMYAQPGSESVVSQFDKDDVEQIGLVKFDFLGLRNLTIIDLALKYVKKLDPSFDLRLEELPFTDPAAYKVLQEANTTAIFQLESDGMKKLLTKLKPDRFEDIIAVLALYRPGPLGSGMVDDFILRKAGKQEIDYFHPDLKDCLSPTYGVIVYQEQVMQISQIIGGYTLGGADMLRRAMGKKKPEEMAKHRTIIAEGAKEKGYNPALAEQLFDLMTKFAEYGFNKSHTAAYAVVSYHTAWLKAHHPAAFMAATLSSELDNTDQLRVFFEDSIDNKLEFLPPDVNESFYRFVPVDTKRIRYALGAIKGTGEQAVEHIAAEREKNGPFKDLFDFCDRTDKRVVNRRTIEALIRAGAFDKIELNRAKLLANVSKAMEHAEVAAANAAQVSLFDMFDDTPEHQVTMDDVEAWDEKVRLQEEKLAIGFYLSGHPFNAYRKEVTPFIRTRLSSLNPDKAPQRLAGIVVAVRTKVGNRGKMAFVTIDDASATQDVTFYAETLEQFQSKLTVDSLLVIEGKVSNDDFSGGVRIIADNVMTFNEARTRFAQALEMDYPNNLPPQQFLDLLAPFKDENGMIVRLGVKNEKATANIELSRQWRIRLDDSLLVQIKKQFNQVPKICF